jgi:hypothetical protein
MPSSCRGEQGNRQRDGIQPEARNKPEALHALDGTNEAFRAA